MGPIIEKIKKFLQEFSKPKGGSVLGIDVSSSTIKVVQLGNKRGKAVLETYGELALGPYAGIEPGKATSLSPQKLGEAMIDLMKEAKVTAKECGVAIPLASSLINVIEMPDVGEAKLKQMVPLELRKYVPVSMNDVVVDWRIVPKIETTGRETPEELEEKAKENREGKNKKVEVLTVAIHKDTIDRYNEVIQQAGLAMSFMEVEVFSTIRVALEEELAPTMIVGLGAGTTKIYIVDRKVLRESHVIPRGSQEISLAITKGLGVSEEQADELKIKYGVAKDSMNQDVVQITSLVVDSLFAEAQRIMLAYQRKNTRNIGKVVLTGGGILIPGIVEKAHETLQADIAIADPFRKVDAPAFLGDVLKKVGPEFDVAIGVALRKLEEQS